MAEPGPVPAPDVPDDQDLDAPPEVASLEEAAPPRPPGRVRRFFSYLRGLPRRALYAVRRLFGVKTVKHRARVYWDEDITLTLNNLVSETETKASGKVQVISLAAFRESIGELWERYRDKIVMIAETSIARRIGRGNTFIVMDEDSWLLLFGRADEAQAQHRADSIAAAIGEKLMGARFAFEEMPLPEAEKLNLADIVSADGTVSLEAVRAQVTKIKAAQRAYATAPSHARKVKQGKTPPKQRIVARARPLPSPGPPPGSQPATAQIAPPVPAAPIPAAPAEEPSRIRGLNLRYRPAWSADSQSVNSIHFRAFTDQGVSIVDDDTAPLNNATALDLVREGLKAFNEMRKAQLPFLFTLPLPLGAFTAGGLGEARELIAALPREDRLSLLRLDFKRLPRTNPEKLVALRELFRSYVHGVAFPINPFVTMDAMLALDHVSYIADVSREAGAGDGEMFEALLLLRNRAGPRPVAVTGLRKRGHLVKAVSAGVAEVSGPALMDDAKHMPERVQRMPREILLGT